MSLSKIRELREKRGKVVADGQALIPKEGDKWTAEAKSKFDAFMNEADEIKTQIDGMEREARASAAQSELQQTQRPLEAQPTNANGNGQALVLTPEAKLAKRDRYRQAYWMTMRCANNDTELAHSSGKLPLLPAEDRAALAECREFNVEARDMGTGGGNALQGTGAGYFVPVGFVYDVEQALKYYGDMLNVATIMDTATGQPLPHPTSNDTTVTGELVGEGAQVSTQDVSISNMTLNAWKYSTKLVKVSLELLQDSAFDLESYLKEQFAIRLGRILNQHFTTGLGSGSSQPNGIITASTVGLSGSTTPAIFGDDNAGTPDNTTQIGYTDLVNLEHSVDRLYRRGAMWMMHDQTLRFIKTLKDKYGHPLWVPGMATNAPDSILSYGYSINNDMAQLGTGHKIVAFGQLKKYIIRRVKELVVMRLVERFADFGQVAFVGFARYDGNLLDAGTHPVKLAQNA